MSVRYVAGAATILLAGAAWQHQPAPVRSAETHVQAESVRLLAHFDAVDAELRARDVSHMSAAQQERRAQLVEWLGDYRNGGAFPLNAGFADTAVPIFRDTGGRLCAMAYLIARSGRADIVDRVASARNTAYIRDLVDDPELVAWLDEWGLAEDEAARIQPAYSPQPSPDADADNLSADYALVSMALAGTSLVSTWVNVTDATRASAVLGLLAGGTTAVAGLMRLDDGGATRTVAAANTAVGVLTIGAAIYGFNALRGDGRDSGVSEIRLPGADLTVAPDVINIADRARLGVVFQARF